METDVGALIVAAQRFSNHFGGRQGREGRRAQAHGVIGGLRVDPTLEPQAGPISDLLRVDSAPSAAADRVSCSKRMSG